MVIPEVKIPWFNVLTKQTEYATLPPRLIKIAPSALADQQTLALTPKVNMAATKADSAVQTSTALSPSAPPPQWLWWSPSSWVLLVLWLSTLLVWALTAGKKNTAQQVSQQSASEQAYWQQLQKALRSNDIQQN